MFGRSYLSPVFVQCIAGSLYGNVDVFSVPSYTAIMGFSLWGLIVSKDSPSVPVINSSLINLLSFVRLLNKYVALFGCSVKLIVLEAAYI